MATLHVSFGPQHPGSGPMRLILDLDGDIVVKAVPDIGYVHRNIEKIAEKRSHIVNVPVLERISNIDSFNASLGYIMAVEELMNITPPPRAQFIRVIMSELNRIMSHLYGLAISFESSGLLAPLYWGIADRELFLDLAEMVTGSRITYTYAMLGGVREDLPNGFKDQAIKTFNYFEKRLDEYYDMIFGNKTYQMRLKGVGVLKHDDAIKLGVTGPTLRGSGVNVDVRVDEPYAAYEQIDFKIITEKTGDSFARAMVRFNEIRESMSIIRKALDKLPEGPFRERAPFRTPEGEAYSRIESGRGEIGYYVVSDGTDKPYRVKISAPSFRNISALPHMMKGAHMADVPIIIFSTDPWPFDSDR
ncbi:MAG TPA: NADH-quinone oxidoreductase subunit D [archaeon]|nr:NADH-quinone oxidoreductase subunit D [archaeon]